VQPATTRRETDDHRQPLPNTAPQSHCCTKSALGKTLASAVSMLPAHRLTLSIWLCGTSCQSREQRNGAPPGRRRAECLSHGATWPGNLRRPSAATKLCYWRDALRSRPLALGTRPRRSVALQLTSTQSLQFAPEHAQNAQVPP